MRISSRSELGALHLPWYVSRRSGTVVEELEAEYSDARQVTVAEVCRTDGAHPVLQHRHPDPAHPGWTHQDRIEHYLRTLSGVGSVALLTIALSAAPAPVLLFGCHRACAIYLVSPPSWSVELELLPPAAAALHAPRHLRD